MIAVSENGMAGYEDLSPCTYFGGQYADRLVAVGWLETWRPYGVALGMCHLFTRWLSKVDHVFFDKLVELLVDPWEPGGFRGWHDCAFCLLPTRIIRLAHKGKTIEMGVNNLFVPGDGFLYAAPSLIAHYVKAHRYLPPEEFCEAVIACPPMNSRKYYEQVIENGPAWSSPLVHLFSQDASP